MIPFVITTAIVKLIDPLLFIPIFLMVVLVERFSFRLALGAAIAIAYQFVLTRLDSAADIFTTDLKFVAAVLAATVLVSVVSACAPRPFELAERYFPKRQPWRGALTVILFAAALAVVVAPGAILASMIRG